MTGAPIFDPRLNNNSDVPLPVHLQGRKSARVGAHVTYPQGGVLDFRNRKWYVQVPRAVLSTHNGTPDDGRGRLPVHRHPPGQQPPRGTWAVT